MSEYDYWDLSTGEGLSDYELHLRYDDYLDEVYSDRNDGLIEIAFIRATASSALKQVDPIAYRVGFSDWVDSELGETLSEEAPLDWAVNADED